MNNMQRPELINKIFVDGKLIKDAIQNYKMMHTKKSIVKTSALPHHSPNTGLVMEISMLYNRLLANICPIKVAWSDDIKIFQN